MQLKHKKSIIALLLISIAMFLIKKENMTWRQSFMKFFYGLIMLKGKIVGTQNAIHTNTLQVQPNISFYSLSATSNNGNTILFEQYKGKKLILVNTASNCGYTGQYTELEELYKNNGDSLVVLGFPANDFRQQEEGTDQEIASFCKINYGVSFPLFTKSVVVKSPTQNPVFAWLSDSTKNGWNNEAPNWNFSKYIINEQGVLTHVFHKDVSPLSNQFLQAIK